MHSTTFNQDPSASRPVQKSNHFIPISKPSITELEIGFIREAAESTWVSSLGEYLQKFENDFASYCGVKHAVSVANGTVALHLALVAHEIGPGDEVMVPNLSFIATANAVLYTGAKPVFVDIDPLNLCMDPEQVRKLITSRTKAIIPVHLYGHPADMQRLEEIAHKHGLILIEDAAEAHGASAYGRRVGSWGACAAFSFYGNKIITSGEGGMITTNDDPLNEKLRHLRDHAMSKTKRYWHDQLGFNYRMTNLQAALGYAQLLRIDSFLQRRQEIFQEYQTQLHGITQIQLNRKSEWADPVYWLVCLELKGASMEQRDTFMHRLKKLNVDTRPYFHPLSHMPYINEACITPVTEQKSREGLNLPTYVDLSSEEVNYIADCIKHVL